MRIAERTWAPSQLSPRHLSRRNMIKIREDRLQPKNIISMNSRRSVRYRNCMMRNDHWPGAGWQLDYHAGVRNLSFLEPRAQNLETNRIAVYTCGDTSLMIWVLSKRDFGRAIAQTLDLMHKRRGGGRSGVP